MNAQRRARNSNCDVGARKEMFPKFVSCFIHPHTNRSPWQPSVSGSSRPTSTLWKQHCAKMNVINLCLGDADEGFPRRFVQLPFGKKKHTLAYGGDDGSITFIDGTIVKCARRFSETVRAVAPSHDGMRVAVGFGDGSTTVFVYESLDGDLHPFLTSLRKTESDDAMFSQIDIMDEDEVSFAGPRFQTPVRSLVFDPRPSNMLACASEDSGFCIVDATSSATLSKKRFLAEQSASEHNETGIRGLAYHVDAKSALLASLDLQGRLCVWDVSGEDAELEYELLHKDRHKCVMKVDQGDINNSEPADQACFPVFGTSFLGLPGSIDLQLRPTDAVDKQLFVPSVDGMGHIEPIVSIAFSGDERFAITAGRDRRIVVWMLEKDVRLIVGLYDSFCASSNSIQTASGASDWEFRSVPCDFGLYLYSHLMGGFHGLLCLGRRHFHVVF